MEKDQIAEAEDIRTTERSSKEKLRINSISRTKVQSTNHERRDDPVEDAILEVERLALFSDPLLTGAERTEVLCSFRSHISEEANHDPTWRRKRARSGGGGGGVVEVLGVETTDLQIRLRWTHRRKLCSSLSLSVEVEGLRGPEAEEEQGREESVEQARHPGARKEGKMSFPWIARQQ